MYNDVINHLRLLPRVLSISTHHHLSSHVPNFFEIDPIEKLPK